jgi:hypothetical protein
VHLNPELVLSPGFRIIFAGSYNLLHSVQAAKDFDFFLMSNSFLAIYAVGGNSLNRIESMFFKTSPKKPINELIATSESLNLS